MWLIRVGLASGPNCCCALPHFFQYKSLHRATSTRTMLTSASEGESTHPLYALSSFGNFSHCDCDIHCQNVLDWCLSTTTRHVYLSVTVWLSVNSHVCLSVPVSTFVLPPVSFSVSARLLFPFCCLPVCLWRLAFIQVLLISATSYRLERNPFSEMSAVCLKATHTANIYVMIADSAHTETEPGSSQPSLCPM